MGVPPRTWWSRLIVVTPLVVLATLAGCGANQAPTAPASSPPASSAAPPSRPAADTTAGPTPSPRDLSGRSLVWFAPLGPRVDHMGYGGSVDYYDLFKPAAAWPTAASRVDVFMVYETWVLFYSTDAELRQVVEGVAARGLALGIEMSGLPASDECGVNVEGFGASLDAIRRIEAAGGHVRLVQFDEIYAFGHVYGGPNACLWPLDRVADAAAYFVESIRTVVPDVLIGAVEPMWAGVSAADLGAFMDAYREAAGAPFDFFHVDADWSLPDWPDRAVAVTKEARARGIPVGLIYNGGDAASDRAWNDAAIERIDRYEALLGGRPDQVVFQSWFDRPDRVLPESDPATFTGLIAAYSGARSTLNVGAVQTPGRGRLEVDGNLVSTDGGPVPDATLTLTATPLDGPYQELRLDGRVPAGATRAVVALRVNEEGVGPGSADLAFYEIGYSEGGARANLVPNPRFAGGLGAWGSRGTGRVTVPAADRGSGRMLRVAATPTQSVGINSGEFRVTPGAAYRLSVMARVPAGSVGSAYLAVVFLDGTEIERQRLILAPNGVPLGDAVTEPNGDFRIAAADLEPGSYRLRLDYAGGALRWPVWAEREVTLE